jgi:hypothetical protein
MLNYQRVGFAVNDPMMAGRRRGASSAESGSSKESLFLEKPAVEKWSIVPSSTPPKNIEK